MALAPPSSVLMVSRTREGPFPHNPLSAVRSSTQVLGLRRKDLLLVLDTQDEDPKIGHDVWM